MTAVISSRTPGGYRCRCGICGHRTRVEPSWATGDVPCPACGCLLRISPRARGWWPERRTRNRKRADQALAHGLAKRLAELSTMRRPASAVMFGLGLETRRIVRSVVTTGRRVARVLVGGATTGPSGLSAPRDPKSDAMWDRWLDG